MILPKDITYIGIGQSQILAYYPNSDVDNGYGHICFPYETDKDLSNLLSEFVSVRMIELDDFCRPLPKLPNTVKRILCLSRTDCELVNGSDITKCSNIKGGDTNTFFSVLSKQPLSVAIQASSIQFQLYGGGIFNDESCYTGSLDHGVTAVGYTEDSIIIKNSWGSSWGDNGYIYLGKTDDSDGICGVYTTHSFPNI